MGLVNYADDANLILTKLAHKPNNYFDITVQPNHDDRKLKLVATSSDYSNIIALYDASKKCV